MNQGLPKPRKPNRAERAAMSQEIELHPGRSLMCVLGDTDPIVLAYLWIAVELNYGIIVFHKCNNAKAMMDAFGAFIPRYHTIIDISRDNALYGGINFTKIIGAEGWKCQLGLLNPARILMERKEMASKPVNSTMPDRVIARSADSLGFLFGLPKYGTSFIA